MTDFKAIIRLFSGSGIDCVIVGGLAATMRGVRRTSTPSPSWKRSSRSAATIERIARRPFPATPTTTRAPVAATAPYCLPSTTGQVIGLRALAPHYRQSPPRLQLPNAATRSPRRHSPPPVRQNHRSRNTTLPRPAKRDRHIASAPAENRRRIANRDSCGRASMRPRGIPLGKPVLLDQRRDGVVAASMRPRGIPRGKRRCPHRTRRRCQRCFNEAAGEYPAENLNLEDPEVTIHDRPASMRPRGIPAENVRRGGRRSCWSR